MPSLLYRPHFFFSRRIYQLSPFFFKQTEGKKEKEESTSINHPRPRVIFLLLRFLFDRLVLQNRSRDFHDLWLECDRQFSNFSYTRRSIDIYFKDIPDKVNEIPGGIFRQGTGLGAGELVGADDHQIDQHAGQPPGDRQSSRREQ